MIEKSAAQFVNEQRQEFENTDIELLMSTESGRRILFRILQETKVWSASFTPGDPYLTAFNEGRRDIGVFILSLIHRVDRYAYQRLLTEHENHELRLKTVKEAYIENLEKEQ